MRFLELQKPVTLTLTLDWVIRHTVVHQSSTSIYTPNFTANRKTFCGRTYVRTDVPTDGWTFPPVMLLGWLGGVDLKTERTPLNWRKHRTTGGLPDSCIGYMSRIWDPEDFEKWPCVKSIHSPTSSTSSRQSKLQNHISAQTGHRLCAATLISCVTACCSHKPSWILHSPCNAVIPLVGRQERHGACEKPHQLLTERVQMAT